MKNKSLLLAVAIRYATGQDVKMAREWQFNRQVPACQPTKPPHCPMDVKAVRI